MPAARLARPIRLILVPVLAAVAGAGLVLPGAAAAKVHARVTLAGQAGPPGSTVKISGAGFGAAEKVVISFDGHRRTAARANGAGRFGPVAVTVPAAALPGTHVISALGRRTGRSGRARFTVRTNWAQFRTGTQHLGDNRRENVLTRAKVRRLRRK